MPMVLALIVLMGGVLLAMLIYYKMGTESRKARLEHEVRLKLAKSGMLRLEEGGQRRADAVVAGVRVKVENGSRQHLATFTLSDGSRVELAVAESEAAELSPGVEGILDWQGSHFSRFETLR
jgi:hypothetical protein